MTVLGFCVIHFPSNFIVPCCITMDALSYARRDFFITEFANFALYVIFASSFVLFTLCCLNFE